MAPAIRYAREGFRLLPQQEFFQAMGPGEVAESQGARRYFLKADGSPYRGFDLVGMDIPAAGAISIQALQIMENFDPASMESEEWAALAGQAIGLAFRDLGRLGSDTAAVRATSKEWAAAQVGEVRFPGRAGEDGLNSQGARGHGTFQSEEEPHFTTHLSLADPQGMVVSLTQTVGPVMGSKVATPGLGFHYAVTMGGYLLGATPGVRARSSISPLVVEKDGVPVLVLGAAGGARIVASVVQVVSRFIDGELSLPEAMAAPRVFMDFDGTLDMETSGPEGWTEDQMERVRRMGLTVRGSPGPVSFALVQALHFDPDTGAWTAVSKPDGEGMAAGLGGR